METGKLIEAIVGIGLKIGGEVVTSLLNGDDSIGNKRVREFAGWREWEKIKVKADKSKLLAELRKRFSR